MADYFLVMEDWVAIEEGTDTGETGEGAKEIMSAARAEEEATR